MSLKQKLTTRPKQKLNQTAQIDQEIHVEHDNDENGLFLRANEFEERLPGVQQEDSEQNNVLFNINDDQSDKQPSENQVAPTIAVQPPPAVLVVAEPPKPEPPKKTEKKQYGFNLLAPPKPKNDPVKYKNLVDTLNIEVKRFKLHSVLTSKQKSLALEHSADYIQTNSGISNFTDYDKLDQSKDQAPDANAKQQNSNLNKISSLICLRKFCRIFYHFLILGFAIAILFLFYYLTNFKGSLTISSNTTELDINMGNCLINVKDGPNFQANYFSLKGIAPYIDQTLIQSAINITTQGTSSIITMVNYFTISKYCIMDLTIPSSVIFQKFQSRCAIGAECYFINGMKKWQASGSISFNQINSKTASIVQGGFQVNIANLVADEFKFTAQSGSLLLNNLAVRKMNTVITVGRVAIQSENSMTINFVSPQQSLCFNAPYITPKATFSNSVKNCWILQQHGTLDEYQAAFPNSNTENCEGQVSICTAQSCGLNEAQSITISLTIGPIFANVISAAEAMPAYTNQYFQSGIYQNATIDFGTDFKNRLLTQLNSTSTSADFIYQIQVDGKNQLQSSSQSNWMYFSNPTFAELRPWWLSTMSLSLLTAQYFSVSGYLSPGLCPFKSMLNGTDLYKIQNLIDAFFTAQNITVGQANLVWPLQQNLPVMSNPTLFATEQSSGVSFLLNDPSKASQGITEDWYRITLSNNVLYLNSISATNNPLIFAAVAISCIVSVIISCICIGVFKMGMVFINDKLLQASVHHGNYCKSDVKENVISKSNKNKQKSNNDIHINLGNLLQRSSFHVFLQEAPIFSSSVDYYVYMQSSKFLVHSPGPFFKFLFRAATDEEIEKFLDGELDEKNLLCIKEKELKNLYEKFCFLNHYKPVSLISHTIDAIVEHYGYEIVNDEENGYVYSKMVKKKDVLYPSSQELGQNSLDLFVKKNYDITGIQADTVWTDDFSEEYIQFCQSYRLQQEEIRTDQIAQQYSLEILSQPRKKLCKNKKSIQDDLKIVGVNEKSLVQRVKRFVNKILYSKTSTIFLIEREKLLNHFSILTDPNEFIDKKMGDTYGNVSVLSGFKYIIQSEDEDLNGEDFKEKMAMLTMVSTLYYKSWFIVDAVIVLCHWAVIYVLIIPILIIILIEEISYSGYTLYDPRVFFSAYDLVYNPQSIPFYWNSFQEYIRALLIIIFYVCIVSFIQDAFLFLNSSFPEDASFRINYKLIKMANFITKLFHYLQWISLFVLIMFLSFYFGIVLIWLLLGAVINPNNFLVYATAVGTLITVATAKLQEVEKLAQKGFDEVKDIVESLYQDTVKSITSSIMNEIKNLQSDVKDFAQGDLMKSAMKAADSLGLGSQMQQLQQGIEQVTNADPNQIAQGIENAAKDPQAAIAKMKNLEKELIEKAKQALVAQLKTHGLTEDVSSMLINSITEAEQKLPDILGDFISNQTNNQINKKMVVWFVQNLIQYAQQLEKGKTIKETLSDAEIELLNKKSISRNEILIESIVESIIMKIMGKDSSQPQAAEEIKNQIKILMQLIHLVINIKSVNLSEIVKILQSILQMFSINFKSNYEEIQTIQKIIFLLQKYFANELDETTIKNVFLEFLELFGIPDDFIMVFIIILTQGSSCNYKYKENMITNQDQLNSFLIEFVKKFVQLNSKLTQMLKIALDLVGLIIKIQNYSLFPSDLKEIIQNIIQFLLNQIINASGQDNEDEQQIIDDGDYNPGVTDIELVNKVKGIIGSEACKLLDIGSNFVSQIVPFIFQLNRNFLNDITSVSDRSKISLNFIQDVLQLSSKKAWSILQSYYFTPKVHLNSKNKYQSRQQTLDNNSLVQIIAKQLRMKPQEFISLLIIMQGEYDDDEFETLDYFLHYYVDKILEIKEEIIKHSIKLKILFLFAKDQKHFKIYYNKINDFMKNEKLTKFKPQFQNSISQLLNNESIKKQVQKYSIPQDADNNNIQESQVDISSLNVSQDNKDNQQIKGPFDITPQNSIFNTNKSDNSNNQIIKNCSFYGYLNVLQDIPDFDMQSQIKNLFSEISDNQDKIQKLVAFLNYGTIKQQYAPLTPVEIQKRALLLASKLSFKTTHLVNLINLIMFQDSCLVAEAIHYFIALDFPSVQQQFTSLKPDQIIKEADSVKQKFEELTKQLILFDNGLVQEEVIESIQQYLPPFIQTALPLVEQMFFDTKIKMSWKNILDMIDQLLLFTKPALSGILNNNQFELFRLIVKLFFEREKQEIVLILVKLIQSIPEFKQGTKKIKSLGIAIESIYSGNMITLYTQLFQKFSNTTSANSSLMAHIFGAFSIQNIKNSKFIISESNRQLNENKINQGGQGNNNEDQVQNQSFSWDQDFIWIASNLKYYFTTNLQSFSEFASLLMKKIFNFDSVSSDQIMTILSLFSENPKLEDAAKMLKKDIGQLEFGSFLVRLSINSQSNKKALIQQFEQSNSIKQLLDDQGVKLEELCQMLKIMCKSLSSEDWVNFLDHVNIGDNANKDIIKSLIGLISAYDINVDKNQDALTKNYLKFNSMRKYIFTNLQLNQDLFELVYLLKRGQPNSLSIFTQNNKFLSTSFPLFTAEQSKWVGSFIGFYNSNFVTKLQIMKGDQLDEFLSTLDLALPIKDDPISALQVFYSSFGINPLFILVLLKNQDALKKYNESSVNMTLFQSQFTMLQNIPFIFKKKLVELEFLYYSSSIAKVFGMDQEIKLEEIKARTKSINELQDQILLKIYELLKPIVDLDSEDDVVVNNKSSGQKQEQQNKLSIAKVQRFLNNIVLVITYNPNNLKGIFSSKFPLRSLLFVCCLTKLPQIHAMKDKQGSSTVQATTRFQKSLNFVLNFDILFGIIEKNLYIEFTKSLENFRKNEIIKFLLMIYFDKNVNGKIKCTDYLNPIVMDVLVSPSIIDSAIHYFYEEQEEYGQLKEGEFSPQQSNIFNVDFTDPQNSDLADAKIFANDLQVRSKILAKKIIMNLQLYQQIFVDFNFATPLMTLDQKLEQKKQDDDFIDQRLNFYYTAQTYASSGKFLQNEDDKQDDKNQLNKKALIQMTSKSKHTEEVTHLYFDSETNKFATFLLQLDCNLHTQAKVSQDFNQIIKKLQKENKNLPSKLQAYKDILTSLSNDQRVAQSIKIRIQNLLFFKEIYDSHETWRGLYSQNPLKLKSVISKMNERNTKINVGNLNSIDLVLKIIDFINIDQSTLVSPQEVDNKDQQQANNNDQNQQQDLAAKQFTDLMDQIKKDVKFNSDSDKLINLIIFISNIEKVTWQQLDQITETYFENNWEIYFGIILPFIRYQSNKYSNYQNLNDCLKYFTYGDKLDINAKDALENYNQDVYEKEINSQDSNQYMNKIKLGDSLESLLSKVQDIPQEQRSVIKIIIRCFLGEVEAWMSLLEQVQLFDIEGLGDPNTSRALFAQILIGINSLNIRKDLTTDKMNNFSVMEFIINSPLKVEFFEIVSASVTGNDTQCENTKIMESIKQIIVNLQQKNIPELVNLVPQLVELLGISINASDQKNLEAIIKICLIFSSISLKNENEINSEFLKKLVEQLGTILKDFSADFQSKYLPITKLEPILSCILNFQFSHNIYDILQMLYNIGNEEIVTFIKITVSLLTWFKMKTLCQTNIPLVDQSFKVFYYPIYVLFQQIIGTDVLKQFNPDFDKILSQNLFQTTVQDQKVDVFPKAIELLSLLQQQDLQKSQQFTSPTLISYFVKQIQNTAEELVQDSQFTSFAESLLQYLTQKLSTRFASLFQLVQKSQTIIKEFEGDQQEASLIMAASYMFGGVFVVQSGFVNLSFQVIVGLVQDILSLLISQTKVQFEAKDYIKNLIEMVMQLYSLLKEANFNVQNFQNCLNSLKALLEQKRQGDKNCDQTGIQDIESILDVIGIIGQFMSTKNFSQDQESQILQKFSVIFFKDNQEVNERLQELPALIQTIKVTYENFNKNGFVLQDCIQLVQKILTTVLNHADALKYTSIFNSIIAIYKKDPSQISNEFFTFIHVQPEIAQTIKEMLTDFQAAIKHPQDFVQGKISQIVSGNSKSNYQVTAVINKLQGNKPVGISELFNLVDPQGKGYVDLADFSKFLKRTGINLTEHKLLEIATSVKGAVNPGEPIQLTMQEFEKSMGYIMAQSILLSMENLGVSKEILIGAFALLMAIIILLFLFIFVGIKAFAVPGTFGSVVNSIFPVAGGGGVAKAKSQDEKDIFDLRKLKETVKNCIKIVQTSKI